MKASTVANDVEQLHLCRQAFALDGRVVSWRAGRADNRDRNLPPAAHARSTTSGNPASAVRRSSAATYGWLAATSTSASEWWMRLKMCSLSNGRAASVRPGGPGWAARHG